MMGVTEMTVRSRMKNTLAEFVGKENGKQVIYSTVFTKYPPTAGSNPFGNRKPRISPSEVKAILEWAKEHKATVLQIAQHFKMDYTNAASILKYHASELNRSRRAVAPFAAAEVQKTVNISLSALEKLLGCSVNIVD